MNARVEAQPERGPFGRRRAGERPEASLRGVRPLLVVLLVACHAPPPLEPAPASPDAATPATLPPCTGDDLEACLPHPVLASWQCPPGWLASPAYHLLAGERPSRVLPHSMCVPPPLPRSCPAGAMPAVGAKDCAPIGAPCPTGKWPENLPGGVRTLYVSAGASGDGLTPQTPLGAINDALGKITVGSTAIVAIAKGRYQEALLVAGPITLWGACAAETELSAPFSESEATIQVLGINGAVVKNLAVTGPRQGLQIDAATTLSGVEVHDAQIAGLVVGSGAWVILQDVAVRRTLSRRSDRELGVGMQLFQGASAQLTRTFFEANHSAGVMVLDAGTSLVATELAIIDTQPNAADGLLGAGLIAQGANTATVSRAVFERNTTAGILIAGATGALEDLVVRDSRSATDGNGVGLYVQGMAKVTVRRALLERNHSAGLFLRGASMSLTDAVVRDGQERANGTTGNGIVVTDDEPALTAKLEVARCVIDGNRSVGLDVEGAAQVIGSEVVIRHTLARSVDAQGGFGLQVALGAQVTLERSALEYNRNHGVFVTNPGTRLQLSRSWITDTLAVGGIFGNGVGCQNPCRCDLSSSLLAHNAGVGLLYSKATGQVLGSRLVANAIGIHVQAGSALQVGEQEPAALGPTEVFVRDDTAFIENVTRIGTGVLPLPASVSPPAP